MSNYIFLNFGLVLRYALLISFLPIWYEYGNENGRDEYDSWFIWTEILHWRR